MRGDDELWFGDLAGWERRAGYVLNNEALPDGVAQNGDQGAAFVFIALGRHGLASLRHPVLAVPSRDVTHREPPKERFESVDMDIQPARGSRLQIYPDGLEPSLREFGERDFAGALDARQSRYFFAQVLEPPLGEGVVVGFERLADLLAVAL